MNKAVISILFVLLNTSIASTQSFNTIEFLCDTCEKDISIRFESTSFLKNNEYSNDFTEGFTGIGFFFKPTVEYYLTKNTKVNAGVYLLKYSGINNFTQAIPVFSVQHKITRNIELVFGSIYGTLNHRLEEPIFRFDRYYQNNVEYGMQFLWNSSSIESDLWLTWEKFIFRNDPFQEEFVVGNTTNIKLYPSDKFDIFIPLQILISHKGGQIDSSPYPAASIVNGLSGLKFNYKINKTNILGFEPLIFWYQGWGLPDTGNNSQIFQNGKGSYLKINYNNEYLSSMLGYWSGNKFIAPKGEYLFQSVSEINDTFFQEERKLVTAKIAIRKKVSGSFNIEVRADGYYDLVNKDLAYSYGLYFVINELFFINKINPISTCRQGRDKAEKNIYSNH